MLAEAFEVDQLHEFFKIIDGNITLHMADSITMTYLSMKEQVNKNYHYFYERKVYHHAVGERK